MGFKNRGFSTLSYSEETLTPERVIIISCEGRNTEPEYFEAIVERLPEYISELIEVKVIPKITNASEPKHIVSNLDKFLEDNYDFKTDYDEMWIVVDREKVDSRKKGILSVIPECLKKNYNIILTNPLFEFWLLLHIIDISTYKRSDLYENAKVNSSRRFIDKELSTLLNNNGGYNKKKGKFNKNIVTKDNILLALKQELLFKNNLDEIIDDLGSNVSELINRILDFSGSNLNQ